MRKRGRVDTNQAEIREALRLVGATVISLAPMGEGCPDLLVGWRQHTYLMEVKAKNGRLTDDQKDWLANWKGRPVQIVHDAYEALAVLGIPRNFRYEGDR